MENQSQGPPGIDWMLTRYTVVPLVVSLAWAGTTHSIPNLYRSSCPAEEPYEGNMQCGGLPLAHSFLSGLNIQNQILPAAEHPLITTYLALPE